jgi:hypothetical protein
MLTPDEEKILFGTEYKKESEKDKEPKKRGRKKGSKNKKTKDVDPTLDAEEAIETLEEINIFISPKLAFSEKHKIFHKRTIQKLLKKYPFDLWDYLIAFRVVASLLMIAALYYSVLYGWITKKPTTEKQEKKDAKEIEIESVK